MELSTRAPITQAALSTLLLPLWNKARFSATFRLATGFGDREACLFRNVLFQITPEAHAVPAEPLDSEVEGSADEHGRQAEAREQQ